MKKNDYFKVGVVSSNAEVAHINSYPGVTNLVDPICITLCTKNQRKKLEKADKPKREQPKKEEPKKEEPKKGAIEQPPLIPGLPSFDVNKVNKTDER